MNARDQSAQWVRATLDVADYVSVHRVIALGSLRKMVLLSCFIMNIKRVRLK
jgi:copper(I)-binding protein